LLVIASAAVPGILNPVVLMQKLKDGSIVPYNYGNKWKDGSLRTDIPVQPLHMHFGVKSTIVSQVNPHIHLFFYAPRGSVGRPVSHRRGRGWRGGFLVASIEQFLKLDLSKWLKLIRDLELLPKVADQDWSSIWLQKFEGNITIWPHPSLLDFFYILEDPTYERLERMIKAGQRVTWPKLYMISNRLRIERAIQKGCETLRRELRKQRNRINDDDARSKIDNLLDDVNAVGRPDELDEHLGIEKVTDVGIDSDYGNSLESSSYNSLSTSDIDDDYDSTNFPDDSRESLFSSSDLLVNN